MRLNVLFVSIAIDVDGTKDNGPLKQGSSTDTVIDMVVSQ